MKFLFQLFASNLLFVTFFFLHDWRYGPASVSGKSDTFSSLFHRAAHADSTAFALVGLLWWGCLGLVMWATGPQKPEEGNHL